MVGEVGGDRVIMGSLSSFSSLVTGKSSRTVWSSNDSCVIWCSASASVLVTTAGRETCSKMLSGSEVGSME